MAPLPCLACHGSRFDGPDECGCCGGAGTVDLRHVEDHYLALFRDEEGCDAEVARRGGVAWGRMGTFAILLTAEDIASGCADAMDAPVVWIARPGLAATRSASPATDDVARSA